MAASPGGAMPGADEPGNLAAAVVEAVGPCNYPFAVAAQRPQVVAHAHIDFLQLLLVPHLRVSPLLLLNK